FTPDGEKYEGEVYDGMRHGQGTLIYPNGAKYEGEFYENQEHGQGMWTSPDGPPPMETNTRSGSMRARCVGRARSPISTEPNTKASSMRA
ncbi:MAG: hypothetical protein ACPIOQ_32670, partial [Promethearchaeia archaeon]